MRVLRVSAVVLAVVAGWVVVPPARAAEPAHAGPVVRASAESAIFTPFRNVDVDSWAKAVAVGDVTGDGRGDVLMTTRYGELFVFAQRPDGTLAYPQRYQVRVGSGDHRSDDGGIALLDADADGRLDVALATGTGVELLRQGAQGTLTSAGILPGSVAADSVVAHDADGDGDADLFSGGLGGVGQLIQEPAGRFVASAVAVEPTVEVSAGDVDGDGLVDVVGVPADGPNVAVHHRTDTGWRRTAHSNGPAPFGLSGVEVADVTGDGRADVITSRSDNFPFTGVDVYAQTASGELASATTHLTKNGAASVESADLDGDGRLELIVVHDGWQRLTALRVDADGRFGRYYSAALPYASHYHTHGLALGDFTGDGRADAVVADHNFGLVYLRNVGGPNPPPGERHWVDEMIPFPGQRNVPVNAAPRVTLSRDVYDFSVSRATVGLFSTETRAWPDPYLQFDPETREITIIPWYPLSPNTTYYLYVYELKDKTGAVGAAPFTAWFRTGASP